MGPYKLLAINGKTYIVNINHRPIQFRSTIIKLYYTENEITNPTKLPKLDNPNKDKQPIDKAPTKQPEDKVSAKQPKDKVLIKQPTVRRGRS